MRAFVALTPPASTRAELADALAPVRAAHPDLRWTPPAQWHLTLAFLSDIDGDELGEGILPELIERLTRTARRHAPMELALAGGGRFGDRVLWTRVKVFGSDVLRARGRAGRDDLGTLAASVGAAARRCKIPVDDRPYRPHLTLARGRPGADLRPAAEALRDFSGTRWTADALHLVRSTLGAGSGGSAAHTVIASWPLGRT